MRADRLIKMMLLLQTRGKLTAKELSGALEVSVRTIYRDMDALGIAGVPIYTEKGPGGGICLLGDYRTSLTGLSDAEVKALFMLNVPGAIRALGFSQDIQGALLKLAAALPINLQDVESDIRQRVIIDVEWIKSGKDRAPSFLKNLYQAIWEDRLLQVVVRYAFGYRAEYTVQAYGLVSSGEHWYLVCKVESHFKAFSLDRFANLVVLEETFSRESNFNLEAFWKYWLENNLDDGDGYQVTMEVSPDILEYIRNTTSVEVLAMDNRSAQDQVQAVLQFEDFSHARRIILGLGRSAKVSQPLALKLALKDYAWQIFNLYEE